MYICAHTSTYMHMYMELRSYPWVSGAVHLALATEYLSGTQGFLVRLGWLAREPSKLCLLLCSPEIASAFHHVGAVDQAQVLLTQQALYQMSHIFSPEVFLVAVVMVMVVVMLVAVVVCVFLGVYVTFHVNVSMLVVFYCSLPYFLRKGLLGNLSLPFQLGLFTDELLRYTCLYAPGAGVTDSCSQQWLSCMVIGDSNSGPHVYTASTAPSHLPSHSIYLSNLLFQGTGMR